MFDDNDAKETKSVMTEKDFYEYESIDQRVFADANALVQWLMNHEDDESDKQTKKCVSNSSSYVICQYDIKGKVINQYSSYGEASIVSGVPIRMIQKAVSGYNRSAGGFMWRRFSGTEVINEIAPLEYVVTNIPQPIQQVSIDGKIVATYDSVRMAVKMTGINRKSIRAVLDGAQKTAGGYYWIIADRA